MLDHDDPPSPSFPSETVPVRWERRGRELVERLAIELGDSAIVRLELPGGRGV
jgi:hypothetical protein